ncbi:MAG: PAS domain S-box protein, partial [Anaerolineae bacterium]|nr:PAS domain S-box protein [Anaerolineae bacterium]
MNEPGAAANREIPNEWEREGDYHDLFEGARLGIYRTTTDGRFLDVTPALAELFCYPDRETMLACNAATLYLDPDARREWQLLIEREGVVRDFETRMRRYDSTVIWVKDTSRVARDAAGQVLYYEGSLEDITERKQLEHHIQQSLERYAQQVQISTEVAQEIASATALDELYRRVVTLVKERFGYYHVQVFRFDAELQAMVVAEGYG